ncbi:hypothetical protein NDU88_000846 [Pleurodeles waltl]|uniref:Uncharacterized protein n=1 Tax=Pleurodeles waltl TaxID=8319 RepID=A0AAV7WK36_PLEWA|nr:hypothetical protein NDU88_000846 [Pleurodeles waltl]
MGTGLRVVSSKLKIGDRGGTALSPKSAAPFWAPIALFIWGGCPGSLFSLLPLSLFLPGGGSFVLRRPDPGADGHSPHPGRPGSADRSAVAAFSCALPGSSEVAPTVRLTSSAPASLCLFRRGGVHRASHVASSPAGGSRSQGQVQAPPVSRAARSPAAVFLAGRPLSRGPAAPVRIRRGSPRPRAHPLRASPLSPDPGVTEPESPRTNEAGCVAPLPAGGPRSQPAPGTSRAAHGTRIGGGPVSGRAPIPGLAETPLARPPSLETYRFGRGQRSRLGLCRHRYRRYLRGPGARGNG